MKWLLFGPRKDRAARRKPPQGAGAADIETQSSICTGETVIGFRDKKTGKLRNAELVRTPAEMTAYYRAYGLEPPKK